ncbi:tail completion protein gp17 [Enterococcus sp. AZ126]|uniref:tail completion protein gp17 n=1 Tax=Enterococcus sp. AZ126 TaxID=2774635 RepID=UPI003F22E989
MNNPYIEIYDGIFKASEKLGFETYDYLPDDEASYPYVFIGEQFSNDQQTKTRTLGKTNLIIHVFGYDHKRREADRMLGELKKAIYETRSTEHFSWQAIASDTQTFYENTSGGGTNLVHCVLDITLQFQ